LDKNVLPLYHKPKQFKMTKYEVLSPDGFTIEFDRPYYTSKEKVIESFNKWKERYTRQGYYSSNQYGRIPLEELENYMTIREI
jgi:hypothetical protein